MTVPVPVPVHEPVPNLKALEALRGWMAWLVVAGHTALLMGVLSPNNGLPMPGAALRLLQSTDAAVRVFIVLSGFAIANLVISKRQPYGQYITCRAFRIFPVYLLSLFVSLLVVDLYALAYTGNPLAGSGSYQAARLAAQTEHFTPHLLLHLTLLHGLVPDSVLPFSETAFLAPAWTISLEWQFYLVAPIVVWTLVRAANDRSVFWITLFALAGVRLFSWTLAGHWVHETVLPLALDYFLLGMLSRIALTSQARFHTVELHVSILLIFMTIGWREALLWGVFFCIALHEVGILTIRSRSFRLLTWLVAYNPASRALGQWSYSTYLIHVPVLAMVFGGWLKFYGPEGFTQQTALLLGAVTFLLVALLSGLLHMTIEKPFINFGRRLFKSAPHARPS